MGNWIKADGPPVTVTLPREAMPTVADLMGKVLFGGGQIAMIVYAVGDSALTLDLQPMRIVDDPEIPPGDVWREVYGVVNLDYPFLNRPRITA
jgi:hypothetical protein